MGYSALYLHKGIPLDCRYEHTLKWSTQAAQLNYFHSTARTFRQYEDFTYLRKERAVRVPVNLETLEANDVNYVSICNDTQWRFYFIMDKVYKADEVTELVLDLDVLQTYQFEWDIPACFVEREHVTDDTIGAHLVAEGLETGELYPMETIQYDDIKELALVAQSAVTLQNPMGQPVTGAMISRVYNGLRMYCRTGNALGATVLNAALSSLDTNAKNGVAGIFMYPKALINADWANENDEVMLEVNGMKELTYDFNKPTTLHGYAPRNRKLLTYPYNYLHVHNNAGECADFRYEWWNVNGEYYDLVSFSIAGSVSQDGVVRCCPRTYRGIYMDTESGLSLTGYPACSWSQDNYKIWLAQNMNQQALSIHGGEWNQGFAVAQGVIGLIGAIASKDVGSGVSSVTNTISGVHAGYMAVQSVMAAREDHQAQPPQARGTQSPSTNIGTNTQTFTFMKMGVQREFAERLDQFFDMYGYTVNTVKVPNLTGRAVWNYVKTAGCVVRGGFDTTDRNKVAAIFDKGVTFWHAPESMYRYDLAASNVAR